VLEVTSIKRQLPVVQAFLQTDEHQMYLEDVEVCMHTVIHHVVHVLCIIGCVCSHMFVMVVVVGMCLSREHSQLKNALEE